MPKFNRNQYTVNEMYAHYVKTTQNPVDKETFKTTLDVWGTIVNEYILQGRDVKFPHGLSTIGVRKREKPVYVDYKASREQGRRVMRSNSHSGFYGARVMWRRHYTTMNTRGWEFEPSRELSRGVAAVMKMPGGHTNFVKKAVVTSNETQSKSTYNKKVFKV